MFGAISPKLLAYQTVDRCNHNCYKWK